MARISLSVVVGGIGLSLTLALLSFYSSGCASGAAARMAAAEQEAVWAAGWEEGSCLVEPSGTGCNKAKLLCGRGNAYCAEQAARSGAAATEGKVCTSGEVTFNKPTRCLEEEGYNECIDDGDDPDYPAEYDENGDPIIPQVPCYTTQICRCYFESSSGSWICRNDPDDDESLVDEVDQCQQRPPGG